MEKTVRDDEGAHGRPGHAEPLKFLWDFGSYFQYNGELLHGFEPDLLHALY